MPIVTDTGNYGALVQGYGSAGQNIGQGLAGLGQGIAAALERKKNEEKLGKQAEQLLTTMAGMPEFGPKGVFAGLIPADLGHTQSRKEQIGTLGNVMTLITLKLKMQQMQQDKESAALLGQERQARTQALTREGAAETAFGQAVATPSRDVMQFEEANWPDRAITAEGDPLSRPETRGETVARGFQKFPAALSVPNVGERVKALQALTGEGGPGQLGDPRFMEVPGAPGNVAVYRGKTMSIATDPTVRARVMEETQRNVIAARARVQATTLSKKDLLKSYQDELKALNNVLNWVGTTPEERAAHRAEIQAKIDAARGDERTPAGGGSNAPGLLRYRKNPQTGKVESY